MADEEANGRGRSLAKIRTDGRTLVYAKGVSVTEFSCMRGRSPGKTGGAVLTMQRHLRLTLVR